MSTCSASWQIPLTWKKLAIIMITMEDESSLVWVRSRLDSTNALVRMGSVASGRASYEY